MISKLISIISARQTLHCCANVQIACGPRYHHSVSRQSYLCFNLMKDVWFHLLICLSFSGFLFPTYVYFTSVLCIIPPASHSISQPQALRIFLPSLFLSLCLSLSLFLPLSPPFPTLSLSTKALS